MDGLKVLLVEQDAQESARISSVLTDANHDVLPMSGFDDASEALQIQKFDAVLLSSAEAQGATEFAAKLRHLEKSQRNGGRTTILTLAPEGTASELQWSEDEMGHGVIDGYLPRRFQAADFSEAVSALANAVGGTASAVENVISGLPVFEPEEFQAQVAHDRELMIEIIDLFLTEREEQVGEIRNAMAAGDYWRLSRAAHTIKGSLASLHAQQAKARAQEIEHAAKLEEAQVCRFAVAQLEKDLEILEPYLLALRDTPQ